MNILIVEDEIRIREGIENLLGKLREDLHIVGEAENGKQGLEWLRSQQIDIVITDIKMPEMDGLEMLTAMTEEGIRTKAIVLSAYSEFEYARKAMKLGVTEYLLKPISYNDFAQAIDNVSMQVIRDRQEKPAEIGTLEQIARSLLDGSLELSTDVINYLEHNYQIKKDQEFIIECVYLGNAFKQKLEKTKAYFQHAFSTYMKLSYCAVEEAHKNSIVYIFYHYQNGHDLERWMQYQILKPSSECLAVGWTVVNGLEKWKEGLNTLYTYLDWNISLNQEIMISYPKITHVQTASCIYPNYLETKGKAAVCASDWDTVYSVMEEFHQVFRDGKVYVPKEIKECYVRFLWALLGIAKELGYMEHKQLDQQKLLSMIMSAKLRSELTEASASLLEIISRQEDQEDTVHLTVKRMKSLIHEFYRNGITLDEIGEKLNMTPEYLGTLFHKEMGTTFSTYMKQYRIGKAKELLCSTSLKLYEIAEQVGYSDAKYFSKVFKEVTGQLPGEYRKTYK